MACDDKKTRNVDSMGNLGSSWKVTGYVASTAIADDTSKVESIEAVENTEETQRFDTEAVGYAHNDMVSKILAVPA